MMPDEIPIFPLQTVLYPGGPLPLRIFETRYLDMVSRCLKDHSGFVVAAVLPDEHGNNLPFQEIGCLAEIRDFEKRPDGLLGIHTVGTQKVRIVDSRQQPDGLNVGNIELLQDEPAFALPDECSDLRELLEHLLEQLPEYIDTPRRLDDAAWVGSRLAEILPLSLTQKQYFLEMTDPLRRLEILRPLLTSLQVIDLQ